jgi:PAS domain S-box-containing protein
MLYALMYRNMRALVDTRKALRVSEADREAILNAIPDLMFQIDRNGIFTNYHASRDELLMVDPNKFLGRHVTDVLPPELAGKTLRRVESALSLGQVEVYEYTLPDREGEPRYYEARAVADGPDRVLTMCRDITVRKRAEEGYRQLAMAVEQASEVFIIADTEGCIQYVNPAFERITGYTAEEAVGRNVRFLKGRHEERAFFEGLVSDLERAGAWAGRMTNRCKDGSTYRAEVMISPIRDGEGKLVNYVAVSRDVTHEEELEKQFLQAQRMESVGRLAGGIAHDFNNLLLSILGVSQLILDEIDEKHPIRSDVQEILLAGESAVKLTRQLLALGRKQEIHFEPLALDDVVQKIHPVLRHALGKNVECVLNITGGNFVVRADAGQIEQVLMNLAVNARDAMPGGGVFTIDALTTELDERSCYQYAHMEPGAYVELRLSDTGMGMSEEVRQHAFEPFFTTKEEGQGTGLGLATVYGIVQQHGGCIEVQSAQDEGTVFRLFFPLIEAAVSS